MSPHEAWALAAGVVGVAFAVARVLVALIRSTEKL